MTACTAARLSFALPIALISQSAFADLTPQDVWGNTREYVESLGYEFSASESMLGTTLVVDDAQLRFPLGERGGDDYLSITLGVMQFVANDDGTVSLVMQDVTPINVVGVEDGEVITRIDMSYTQAGHSMTFSGEPDNLSSEFQADSLALSIDSMMDGGNELDMSETFFTVTATDFVSVATTQLGELRNLRQSGSIGSLKYDLGAAVGSRETFMLGGEVSNFTYETVGSLSRELAVMVNMAEMIRSGVTVDSKINFAASSLSMKFDARYSGSFDWSSSSTDGFYATRLGPEGVAYDINHANLKVDANFDRADVPIASELGESAISIALPVLKSEDAQDFELGLALTNLSISEALWSLFDPGSQLGRDPASLDIDITGKAKLLFDLFDPGAAAQLRGAPPAELNSFTLGRLFVSAAGVALEGSGAIEVDPNGPPMIPGIGMPVGAFDVSLAGANGLIDNLVAMGILPQEQLMGARMMMGAFTVPGDAPDTIVSKIELTQEGQIFANGQRIQ
ncbi:MAG: DUF2125 domain-containing protein [Pseudomonadota bacterium]